MARDDAIKVLKEVQNAQQTLEQNILEVCRKHEQIDLFNYFDEMPLHGGEENFRIKKKISDKIKEISNEIKDEVYTKKVLHNKKTKGHGRFASTPLRQPLTQINRTSANINSNIPQKPLKPRWKKGKTKEGSKKSDSPPPVSSTAYDELIFQHIYGRQPHQAHRHTNKIEKAGFCSPHKVVKEVKIFPLTAPQAAPLKQFSSDVQIKPCNDYCIHLQQQCQVPFSIDHNFPNAVSLVEPSRSLSERLPKSTIVQNERVEEKDVTIAAPRTRHRRLARSGPNAAVINVKADDMGEEGSVKDRIRKKVRERLRNKMKLNIQPLPNIDIDTTEPSSLSTFSDNSSRIIDDDKNERTKDSSEINNDVPCSFQEFICVQDLPGKRTDDSRDEVEPEDSFEQPGISLLGCQTDQRQDGPAFPPLQFLKTQENIDVFPVNVSSTMEQNAYEWVEKELLARLISQMMEQESLTPARLHADQVSVLPAQSEEDNSSYDWVDNIIGLQGLQLFIDAGISVNKDLVIELIRAVILERLEILFGYPSPERVDKASPREQCVETNIQTPPQTPEAIPSLASEHHGAKTPDQTISDVTEQIVNDLFTEIPSANEEDVDELHYETVVTPNVSIAEKEIQVVNETRTPDVSLVQDSSKCLFEQVKTPSSSDKGNLTPIPLSDFEFTEKNVSPRTPVSDDKRFSAAELDVTPPPIVITESVVPATASTTMSSSYYTSSSSTSVGLNTFEGISFGEYLNSNSGVSDGSVGELRLPGGDMKVMSLLEDTDIIEDSFIESRKLTSRKQSLPTKQLPQIFENGSHADDLSVGEVQPLKSIGEVTSGDQSNVDTEGTENNTDALSSIKANKVDPMVKLLEKVNGFSSQERSYKSEGEIVFPSQRRNDDTICSGENSLGILNQDGGILNQDHHFDSSIQDIEQGHDATGGQSEGGVVSPHTVGNVINVKPVSFEAGKKTNFNLKHATTSDIDVSDNTYSLIGEISKSESLNLEVDVGDALSDGQLLANEASGGDNDKVVMVLRLPEMDDYQNASDNISDNGVSDDDISTLSEL